LPRKRSLARFSARHIHAVDLEDAIASMVLNHHPDLSESALRLATNLKRAATVLVQREESAFLSEVNRSSAAVRALTMIWMFEPVEARDIARLSGYSRQAVSGVLTLLERDGLIVRERAASSDRRLAPVSITQAGRAFVEAIIPRQNRLEADYFARLSEVEQRQLASLLAKLIIGAVADDALDEDAVGE
jgi:DNA-binding MarR family transcriptional regulator